MAGAVGAFGRRLNGYYVPFLVCNHPYGSQDCYAYYKEADDSVIIFYGCSATDTNTIAGKEPSRWIFKEVNRRCKEASHNDKEFKEIVPLSQVV